MASHSQPRRFVEALCARACTPSAERARLSPSTSAERPRMRRGGCALRQPLTQPVRPPPFGSSFYGAYHSDKTNQLIHLFCVPAIYATSIFFLTRVPLPRALLVAAGAPAAAATAALPAALAYGAYYLYLSPTPLGASAAALAVGALWGADAWSRALGARAMPLALAVHVGSWLAQFVGHGVFEGRAPALLDNLVQALVMAPFFVLTETLMHCGLLQGLARDVEPRIAARIADFKKAAGKRA